MAIFVHVGMEGTGEAGEEEEEPSADPTQQAHAPSISNSGSDVDAAVELFQELLNRLSALEAVAAEHAPNLSNGTAMQREQQQQQQQQQRLQQSDARGLPKAASKAKGKRSTSGGQSKVNGRVRGTKSNSKTSKSQSAAPKTSHVEGPEPPLAPPPPQSPPLPPPPAPMPRQQPHHDAPSGVAATIVEHIVRDASDSRHTVAMPVLEHRWRRRGCHRGLGLPLLECLLEMYARRGELGRSVVDTCRDLESASSVCSLTRTTGLSLAETAVLCADRAGLAHDGLVGPANAYFVYAWLGTSIGDLLRASIRALRRQEAMHGVGRKLFIDLFCASQNLIAGRYGRQGGAREGATAEDYDASFESVFEVCDTVVLHLSPVAPGARWAAPVDTHRQAHQFLDERRGAPEPGWVREGPVALTRAWCVKELAQGLAAGCALLLETDEAGQAALLELLRRGEGAHAAEPLVLVDPDFRDVQIRRAADRPGILRRVEAAGGYPRLRQAVLAAIDQYLIELRAQAGRGDADG